MNFPLSCDAIARIVGVGADHGAQQSIRANVAVNWPLLEAALDAREIFSAMTAVAAIGTVATETAVFAPTKENGGPQYLAALYEGRADLGNTNAGDGVRFCGRGFIQITGRWDYEHFGAEIGKDLGANPALALDPGVAANILAVYFRERRVPEYADAKMWRAVRQRVNGGMRGWPRFISVVASLLKALENPAPLAAPEEMRQA